MRFVLNGGSGSDKPAAFGANPATKARVATINAVHVATISLAQSSIPKIYPKKLSVSDMLAWDNHRAENHVDRGVYF